MSSKTFDLMVGWFRNSRPVDLATERSNMAEVGARYQAVPGVVDEPATSLLPGSSTGAELFASTKVEYPQSVPFDVDVDVDGVSRIRLTVRNGTNAEFPCWCDARFTH